MSDLYPPDPCERIAIRRANERAAREAKWAATSDEEILRMRIEESAKDFDPVSSAFLGLAVPMWIDQMRCWPAERRERKAHDLVEIVACAQGVAAMCDADARGTERKGGLAIAFNAVAQGLACLAFCPGGIVFAGHHWEVTGG